MQRLSSIWVPFAVFSLALAACRTTDDKRNEVSDEACNVELELIASRGELEQKSAQLEQRVAEQQELIRLQGIALDRQEDKERTVAATSRTTAAKDVTEDQVRPASVSVSTLTDAEDASVKARSDLLETTGRSLAELDARSDRVLARLKDRLTWPDYDKAAARLRWSSESVRAAMNDLDAYQDVYMAKQTIQMRMDDYVKVIDDVDGSI